MNDGTNCECINMFTNLTLRMSDVGLNECCILLLIRLVEGDGDGGGELHVIFSSHLTDFYIPKYFCTSPTFYRLSF